MRRGRAGAVAVLAVIGIAAGLAWWCLRPPAGPDITALAKQPSVAADPGALSTRLIPGDDLPPAGTRSLFDHLIARNGQIPYPFDRLIALIPDNDPDAAPPPALLIPHGRSLLKALADDRHPRVVVAADFQARTTPAALGLNARAQLFLGFVENAHEIEVISYNEAAGRYEFQLVQNYCAGCIPRLVYARRAICTTCHQGASPIFPVRPWNETNGQPETAAKIAAARGAAAYLGVPVAQPLGVPERFEELAITGAFVVATQRMWIDGCGSEGTARPATDGRAGVDPRRNRLAMDGHADIDPGSVHRPATDGSSEPDRSSACRRQMLKVALSYLWDPAGFDANGGDAQALRRLQAAGFPAGGIAVAQSDLPNRDPIAEMRGIKGFFRTLFTRPIEPGEGAKTNEDLAAFDKLPKLPAAVDPLTRRAPRRMLGPADLDGAYGVAALISDADRDLLEAAADHQLPTLLAAVDRADPALYRPAVFSRVKTVDALLVALGRKPRDYCCLSTRDLSPPVASGEPPVAIAAGSPVEPFERYCFACHRGNPSQKLNFMSGKTEAEVLSHIQGKTEIRDALDWSRYQNTDKANKLMPPADSVQRQQIAAALTKDPKLLERMRATVPGLFDF